MTVLSVQDSYSQYTGTGDRTFYEYGFDWDGEPVNVRVDGRPAAYTQQANGIVFDVAPALGVEIIIARETPLTQETDFRVFGPFDAAKTEDAMDKLILLKQESSAYRAKVNLYADQQLSYTDLVNDTGTTPRITLWNEGKSGVFSGEVTMEMPQAGSFVEKPEDFVYFQYDDTPILTEEITTTLYPVEVLEGIQLGAVLGASSMTDVPTDEAQSDMGFIGAILTDVRIEYGPDVDQSQSDMGLIDVVLTTVRLSYGPDIDESQSDMALIDVVLVRGKVSAQAPTHGLDIGCSFDSTNSYMMDET